MYILDTIELIRQIKPPSLINLFSLRLYPGTELFRRQQEGVPFGTAGLEVSYRDYQPLFGNFLIGMMNFIFLPDFFMRWLRRNKKVLFARVPRLLMKVFSLLFLVKYMRLYMRGRDYLFVPSWLVGIDRLFKGRKGRGR